MPFIKSKFEEAPNHENNTFMEKYLYVDISFHFFYETRNTDPYPKRKTKKKKKETSDTSSFACNYTAYSDSKE